MDKAKRKRLEAKGWKSVSVSEFLNLSPEEEVLIELKLILSKLVKKRRVESHLTQLEFAKKLHSSQSRVAKIEAGDPSVSFDLLIKSVCATGIDAKDLGKILVNPDLAAI